jgi:trimeric autotransporter adhesin
MRISAAALAIVLLASPVQAADHVGRVTLAGSTPVPGARVTATQGSNTLVTTTDTQGGYRFAGIADGTWTIQVEMVGLATQRRDIVVASGAAATTWELAMLPFSEITRGVPIPPPAPPPDLTRRAAPPRAEGRGAGPAAPEAFQRAGVVASAPANPAAAAAAAAAAAKLAAGRGGGPAPPPPPPAGEADAFLVSGSVNAGGAQPSVGNVARPTGIRLFRGQINIAGTNSAWDARQHSLTGVVAQKPDTSSLNIGGILQGPFRIPGLMRTNRTMLFQYNRSSNNSANLLAEQMPTLRQRDGDFSQTLDGFGNPVQIVDPLTGQAFAGNVIPADRISPQAAALLRYYPLPDAGATAAVNYQIPAFSSNISHNVSLSIANLVSTTTNQLGVNGGYGRTSNRNTSLFDFNDSSRGSNLTVGVNWSRRFLPSNRQIRFRHTYTRNTNNLVPFFAYQTNVSGEAGITGNNQDPENWGPPGLSFASGIAGLSTGQFSSNRTQSHAFNVETQRSTTRHSVVIGGNARYQRLDLVSQQNARGSFTFNGSFTGHDFADFLLGLPNTSSIAYGNADKRFNVWTYDAYINDDFRVGPNLTLSWGVRWEFEVPVTERYGRLVNVDVADDFSAAAPVIASDGVGPITGRDYPSALIKSDPWGIQPRFGLAWRPVPTSSVILRAGYGIYRNTTVYQALAQQMAQQPPLSFAFNSTSTPDTPLTLANGFIAPVAETLNTVAFDPDYRIGTVHRWQASAQRDLPGAMTVIASYLAGKGVNLPQAFIPNTYPIGVVNPCPLCPTGFVYNTSGGTSIQHAGQFEVRRRLMSGLQWRTSYTLTTANDNASSFQGFGGAIAQNWLDLDAERAPSSFLQRHTYLFNVTYNTGQGIGGGALRSGWVGRLVNGWSTNWTLTTGSGTPRTPVYRVTSVAGVTGTVRADLTGEPIDGGPDGYYANPDAFRPPAEGTWGNAPRNSIRGPASFGLNASGSRSFQVANRYSMNFSINVTNVFNTVTYTGLNTTVGSPQFGLPTATSPMRRIRTSLSVTF